MEGGHNFQMGFTLKCPTDVNEKISTFFLRNNFSYIVMFIIFKNVSVCVCVGLCT